MSLGKDHRVELEPYTGPLDLLLWLIRQEEVDVHDIPIRRILTRYLEMLRTIQALDLDQAGEFLVMASTLMQIKSRSLLPREDPLEDEELDPRFELVRKLLEYRRFKEISEELASRAEAWSLRHPPGRPPEPPGTPPDEIPLGEASIWDLALAFQRLVEEVGPPPKTEVVYDDVPIEAHIDSIVATLKDRRRVPFRELFPAEADRTRIAGLFLALLELIKRRRVRAVQERAFGPIDVEALSGEEAVPEAGAPPDPPA